jgi:hypothetical protein
MTRRIMRPQHRVIGLTNTRRAGSTDAAMNVRTAWMSLIVLLLLMCGAVDAAVDPRAALPPETPAHAAERHKLVAKRRADVAVICHRGASEFAHENTLDAYRATFELGGDGNEIDIRKTRDGVLVVFHDDLLDLLLRGAYGDVSDVTWAELQTLPFRDPGPMAATAKIPTLAEVFELHRQHGGLLVLDVKRPGLDDEIADLLQQADMWDHIIGVNTETAPKLAKDPRIHPEPFKAGLFNDRSDVFAADAEADLKLPGDNLICDDPRACLVALGRKLGKVSPGSSLPEPGPDPKTPPPDELIAALKRHDDWDHVAADEADQAASAQKIIARARAADQLFASGARTPEAIDALLECSEHRSLHKQWLYHGLDGATALRAALLWKGKFSLRQARDVLWTADPALAAVRDPKYDNPLAWTDWRIKSVVFPALATWRDDPDAAQLCRDYLALTDAQAREIGIPLFERAAKALLEVTHDERTATELMQHRLKEVRGRAILVCLAHADEPWAIAALKADAPHALAYIVKRD